MAPKWRTIAPSVYTSKLCGWEITLRKHFTEPGQWWVFGPPDRDYCSACITDGGYAVCTIEARTLKEAKAQAWPAFIEAMGMKLDAIRRELEAKVD